MIRAFVGPAVLAAAIGLSTPAWGEYSINWFTVDGGCHSFSTGGTYVLNGGFWLGGGAFGGIPDRPNNTDTPLVFGVFAGLTNPFSEQTGIRLDLPSQETVEIRIFDHGGRLVRLLYDGVMRPGRHLLSWGGVDDLGQRVTSGAYVLQVRAGSHETRRRSDWRWPTAGPDSATRSPMRGNRLPGRPPRRALRDRD